jgi:hypothetical protein
MSICCRAQPAARWLSWLHGKGLYALLVDKRLRARWATTGAAWTRSGRPRGGVLEADAQGVGGADQWRALLAGQQWTTASGDARRPRQRTLQRLPAALCPLPVPDCIATALDQPWNEAWEKEIAA